jgi:hypothetical protein
MVWKKIITSLMKTSKKTTILLFSVLFSVGCLNMPTPSSQIGPSHVSSITYTKFTCDELASEFNSLQRRETALNVAQNQRHKTSQMQAFWWGFGQGDGIEAAELATVRGQLEAVRKEMEKKGCGNSKQPEGN